MKLKIKGVNFSEARNRIAWAERISLHIEGQTTDFFKPYNPAGSKDYHWILDQMNNWFLTFDEYVNCSDRNDCCILRYRYECKVTGAEEALFAWLQCRYGIEKVEEIK